MDGWVTADQVIGVKVCVCDAADDDGEVTMDTCIFSSFLSSYTVGFGYFGCLSVYVCVCISASDLHICRSTNKNTHTHSQRLTKQKIKEKTKLQASKFDA